MGKRKEKRTRVDGVVQSYEVGSDVDANGEARGASAAAAASLDHMHPTELLAADGGRLFENPDEPIGGVDIEQHEDGDYVIYAINEDRDTVVGDSYGYETEAEARQAVIDHGFGSFL